MSRIVEILMKRDRVTQQEAMDQVQEVRNMMEDCAFDPEECEQIMMDELGLEPDYIMNILDM